MHLIVLKPILEMQKFLAVTGDHSESLLLRFIKMICTRPFNRGIYAFGYGIVILDTVFDLDTSVLIGFALLDRRQSGVGNH